MRDHLETEKQMGKIGGGVVSMMYVPATTAG
jgi:hypothetical protein